MDRDVFLSRVGRAAMTSKLPSPPEVPERLAEFEESDLVALFRQRALDVDAVVHGPMSTHGVPNAVAGIAAGHEARTVMAWDDLPVAGITSALLSAGLQKVEHDVPVEGRQEHQLGYYDLDLGLTGAIAGFAESGSVVLSHGPGRPRMASLFPDVHIALLEVAKIEPTLAHWAHDNPDAARETANLVIVAGPSRTGDIEQQLNLGVHGPRHVHVVLIK